MNKYLVKLYSRVNNETSAWIAFLVDTSMTAKQLKTFYEYGERYNEWNNYYF